MGNLSTVDFNEQITPKYIGCYISKVYSSLVKESGKNQFLKGLWKVFFSWAQKAYF